LKNSKGVTEDGNLQIILVSIIISDDCLSLTMLFECGNYYQMLNYDDTILASAKT
jgi:hypothetical protein